MLKTRASVYSTYLAAISLRPVKIPSGTVRTSLLVYVCWLVYISLGVRRYVGRSGNARASLVFASTVSNQTPASINSTSATTLNSSPA